MSTPIYREITQSIRDARDRLIGGGLCIPIAVGDEEEGRAGCSGQLLTRRPTQRNPPAVRWNPAGADHRTGSRSIRNSSENPRTMPLRLLIDGRTEGQTTPMRRIPFESRGKWHRPSIRTPSSPSTRAALPCLTGHSLKDHGTEDVFNGGELERPCGRARRRYGAWPSEGWINLIPHPT